LAVIFILLAYASLYRSERRRSGNVWLGSPIRIVLPAFCAFQALAWLRCLLVAHDGTFFGETPEFIGYPPEMASAACAQYCLLHYLFFLSQSFTFRAITRGTPRPTHPPRIHRTRTLVFAAIVLITAILGFTLTYGKSDIESNSLLYITSLTMRLVALPWMLTAIILFSPGRGRVWAALLLAVTLWLSILSVEATQIRFFIFAEVASVGVVLVTHGKIGVKRLGVIAALILATSMLFALSTAVKRYDGSDASSVRSARSLLDAFVTRSASFHADAAAEQSEMARTLFTARRDRVTQELFAGIPFSSLVFGRVVTAEGSFDMAFYWALTGYHLNTSFFVPALTAIRYSYGIAAVLACAVLFGISHGFAAGRIMKSGVPRAWLICQAVLLPIMLNGFAKPDLFRVLVNFGICMYVVRVCHERRGQSKPSAAPLSSGFSTRRTILLDV
jgi:hypothetical protein